MAVYRSSLDAQIESGIVDVVPQYLVFTDAPLIRIGHLTLPGLEVSIEDTGTRLGVYLTPSCGFTIINKLKLTLYSTMMIKLLNANGLAHDCS